MVHIILKIMCWVIFWAIFSQTHPATLFLSQNLSPEQGKEQKRNFGNNEI
jgi:hypothetical protein